MSLNADTLIDRSYLKGQITKWRTVAIVVIVLSLLLLTTRVDTPITSVSHIARVKIEGVIADDLRRDELFADLAEDAGVKGVVVWIDSPGGTVVGGEQLYLNIKRLSGKKPVVVVMRSLATSAGYMAAIGANRVYARQGTITGSIGVIMQAAEVTELVNRMGITPITIKSGINKATPNPFEKMTPESREIMEAVVADFHGTFVDMVAEARKMDRDKVLQLADGRVYTGPQALELGLVDALGGEEDAVEWLKTEHKLDAEIEVHDHEPKPEHPRNLGEFFGQVAQSFAIFPQIQLDGLVSIWQPKSM